MNEIVDIEVGKKLPNLLKGFHSTDVMLRLSVF